MRFHIVSLPHTETTADYCWCAYTAKVRRFCNMMTSLGHEVFLYAGTRNEAQVTEHIEVVTEEDRKNWFGHYDWNCHVYGDWELGSPPWVEMNRRASEEIAKRKQPRDILGIIGGLCQEQLIHQNSDMLAIEWGVGYEGILDGFRVFESYAWMHHIYGKKGINDGKFFDTVIPNAFEEDEIRYSDKKDDYLLYLGRLTPRKGMEVVELLAKRGHKIKIAGQGEVRIPGTEYVGVVRGEEKKELLAKAKALLCPTFYIEPFGGVAVEAMLSGTPVICTDFGAFTETVPQRMAGYRCQTMGEFYKAVDNVGSLDNDEIRVYASKFLAQKVRYQYQAYFNRLQAIYSDGWYAD